MPEQGAYLVDMRSENGEDCTYMLMEWRESIPAKFQKSVVNLAEVLEAQIISLLPAADPDKNCT